MGQKLVIGVVVAAVILGVGYYAKPDLLVAGDSDTRFVMKKTSDGFLRMDTKTGKISVCRPKVNSWVCQAVADDREVLEKEIARLEDRVGVLKRYIKKSESSYFNLPSDKEVDQVLSYFEGLVKRFRGFADFLNDEEEKVDDNI
jgi:hypothetical protein